MEKEVGDRAMGICFFLLQLNFYVFFSKGCTWEMGPKLINSKSRDNSTMLILLFLQCSVDLVKVPLYGARLCFAVSFGSCLCGSNSDFSNGA